jgi:uncharacterized protein YceK
VRRIVLLLSFAATALLSGCGTAANTLWFIPEEGGMRVYGGVRADWESARQSAADPSRPAGPLWLCIADMPLSAVGDTLTLPFTVPAALCRSLPTKKQDRAATPATLSTTASQGGPSPPAE